MFQGNTFWQEQVNFAGFSAKRRRKMWDSCRLGKRVCLFCAHIDDWHQIYNIELMIVKLDRFNCGLDVYKKGPIYLKP